MEVHELLADLLGRVDEHVHEAVDGLSQSALVQSPVSGSNPIGWLIWHLARVEDHHVAELVDDDQVWITADWAQRFGLEPDPENSGYGHDAAGVASVQPESAAALVEYYDAVRARTRSYIAGLVPADLDRIVDRRWDPPVTLGVRLVSIIDDEIQHSGQAAYARGMLGS